MRNADLPGRQVGCGLSRSRTVPGRWDLAAARVSGGIKRLRRISRRLAADQAGQTSIEWALIMACFGVPMVFVFGWLLSALAEHYRMVSFFETLPFP